MWNRLADKTWNRVERGCAPVVQVLVIYAIYLGGLLWLLTLPERDRYIDVGFALAQLIVSAWVLAVALLLLGIGLVLRVRKPDSLLYQHVGAQFFALTLVWSGYVTGMQSFATGVVLIGAALAGYIALERRVIFISVLTAFLLVLLLNLATSAQLLPYAPLLIAPGDDHSRLVFSNIHLFLGAPHVIMYLLVIGLMIHFWRARENVIRRLSLSDALTGLHNRRSVLDHVSREVARSQRHGTRLALVLIDLDNFKQINDRWGHPVGDRVLQAAAACLRKTLRRNDVIGRFGGEEFLVLLPDTLSDGAMALMERCRDALEKLSLHSSTQEAISVTASFGVVCNEHNPVLDVDTLVSAADKALYQAKHGGRNRIVLANTAHLTPRVAPASTSNPRPRRSRMQQARHGLDALVQDRAPWTPVLKTALMLALGVAQLTLYTLMSLLLLVPPMRDELVNVEFVGDMLPFAVLLIGGMLALAAYGLRVNRMRPDSSAYQYLAHQYYAFTFVFFAWMPGTLTLPVGLILVSAPLVGLIFLTARPVICGSISSLATLTLITYASAFDMLPYAPIMPASHPPYAPASPLWLALFYAFIVPHLLIALHVADRTLGHWRERSVEVRELSRIDMLTGVQNRRSILQLLDKEIARTWRHGPPLAVLLMDLDHFKQINDTWGHPLGDAALQHCVRVLKDTVRECDVIGRIGGEEFMLLMPDTSLQGAQALAERCRQALERTPFISDSGEQITLTGSFGLTGNAHSLMVNSEQLYQAADDALYDAKAGGRNRVETTLWAMTSTQPG